MPEQLTWQRVNLRGDLQIPGHLLQTYSPDAVLLTSRGRKKHSGTDLQTLRGEEKLQRTPILVFGSSQREEDMILALDEGADDYILQPTLTRALFARLRAAIRRARGSWESKPSEHLANGSLAVHLPSHRVYADQQEVELTLTEFKVLVELMSLPGAVLSRDQLMSKVFGSLNVSSRTIDVHVAAIRKKLGQHAHLIETVRGVGYRLARPGP